MKLRALASQLLDVRFLADAQPYLRLPPQEKRLRLASIAEQMGVDTFVETGTYLGQTTRLLAGVCKNVVTIEIDPALHARAVESLADLPNVKLLLGDSGTLLPQVLSSLTVPALFWLDGHKSGGITSGGDTPPILQELDAIFAHPVKEHVIVVDDVRLFRGRQSYPRLKTVLDQVTRSGYVPTIDSDLLRIQQQDI